MSKVPSNTGTYNLVPTSETATDPEDLVSAPIASTSATAQWVRPFKAAAILGITCVAVIALVAYSTKPALDPESHKDVLGFDTKVIIQKSSNTILSNHTCPDGFAPTHLDMMNHDADMHELTLSLEKCAEKCAHDNCTGMEFNDAAGHCWISRSGHHCTDKQHEGWVSCIRTAQSCPPGYSVTDMDMQNHDADMHEEHLSAEKCAEKCDEDDTCKGFEYNEDADHCWITRGGHHCTEKQHAGWVSCIKAIM